MRIQTYTLAHGPEEIITLVVMPAFSTPKSVVMVGNDIKISVMTPRDAPDSEEMFAVYANGAEIPRPDLVNFVGSCAGWDGGIWHVFHVPPRHVRLFVTAPSSPQLTMEPQLTAEHIASVCKRGRGELCCRYLMMGPGGWCCARAKGQAWIDQLDERVKAGTIRARGSNCGGCEGTVPL